MWWSSALRPCGHRHRLGAALADEPLQPEHQLQVRGQGLAVEHDRSPAEEPLQPLGQCHRAREGQPLGRLAITGHGRRTYRFMRHRTFTRRCHTSAMSLDTHVEDGPTGPEEVFDVDPPYVPEVPDDPSAADTAALEMVRKHEDRFLDRELSWLRLNQRVLELAEDRQLPLLERVRFAAIFTSNLDEFFMVRVAGLKRRIAAGLAVRAASGALPREVLEAIWDQSEELSERHARLFRDDLVPELRQAGIELVRWADLDREEQKYCKKLFKDRVFPVLTPLAVDPAHPFPYISGLSLNLAVVIRNPKSDKQHFARVKVPQIFARFVPLGDGRFVPLEDVIGEHLKRLFPGMEILEVHTFRVTRNEDLEVEEDDAENLLAALEKELLRRKFGPPVRLEVEESMTDSVLELLISELGVSEQEVFRLPGPLDLRGLHGIADQNREDLKFPAFVPTTHPLLAEVESSAPVDVFKATRRHDVLLHHPYDSFATSVQRFIEQAAADPHVLAIKQTLYRTSGDSPIIDALIDAAEAGKQVLVLVEIKARFDEEANIRWARKLEQAGCHVVYGLVGLKTHCKLAMVVRDEPDGIRRYTHIGTGNYNSKTARLYEDLGLITTDETIGEDVAHLFNNLSGLVAQRGVRPAARRPRPRPQRAARADPPGDRAPPGRPAGADPDEDELAGRRARDRRALRRLVGGCAGPADHPRDLRAAPRRTRPLGVDRGPVDPGPVPRAQPGLLVRQRRRAGGVDRVRGHDAPQPGPADRGAGAAAGGRAGRGGGRDARPGVRPGHGRVGAAQRRRVGAQQRPGRSTRRRSSSGSGGGVPST